MAEREWTVYCNEDGEPWAIFLEGHDHDLRTLKSVACKSEIREAFIDLAGDDDGYFHGNLDIGRWWIKDLGEDADDSDHPWQFCHKDDSGARPITGAKF